MRITSALSVVGLTDVTPVPGRKRMNDTRDLRDPQKLGEFLLRNKRPNRPLSFVADETLTGEYPKVIPNYPQDESLATITAREYLQELTERAANGDRYAESMLRGEADESEVV